MSAPSRLDWLISEWIAADQIEKDAAERKTELFTLIAAEMGPGESRAGVKMHAGQRRFDVPTARIALAQYPKQFELVSVLTPQPDLAKKYLDEELLAACQKITRPYLRLAAG